MDDRCASKRVGGRWGRGNMVEKASVGGRGLDKGTLDLEISIPWTSILWTSIPETLIIWDLILGTSTLSTPSLGTLNLGFV